MEPGGAEGRRSYDALRAMGFGPLVDPAITEGLSISGPAGSLRARLYRPSGSAGRGLFVHVHGGGYVAGSIEGYDKESHAFATLGECAVLTFEYRLAPECRFPAGVDDTIATLEWAFENADRFGCDASRIGIGGDSAGANLAAVAAIVARDRDLPLAYQLLIYPNTDSSGIYDSLSECAEMETLSRADVLWARGQYLRDASDEQDWRAFPYLAASLAGVAPARMSISIIGSCRLRARA